VNEFKSKETKNLYFASSPERVNPGDFVWNLKNTPRLLGYIDTSSMAKGLEFYKTICEMVIPVSSPEVAEAAKLLENTFRLVNIALVNEFAQICSVNNLDINEVIDAATSKPYGYMSFRPGVGVGGHCIPVDPLYLTWWAKQNGIQPVFVESADSINRQMPKFIANRALSLIANKLHSPRVLILGVAYKPGVSDVRETPVAELRDQLLAKGAEVAWYDPLVSKWEDSTPVNLEWDCDVAILATMQPGMNLKPLINRGTKILDCTNTLDKSQNIIGI